MTSTFREEVCISDLTTDSRVITEAEPPYRIVHVNQAWCDTTGHSPATFIGQTCKVLQGPETCKRTMQASRSCPGRRGALRRARAPGSAAAA